MSSASCLYIVLISVHGLVRGDDLELGSDSDTGGQTKYVVELARALAERADVASVDLVTRCIIDNNVNAAYSEPSEPLSAKARIIRVTAGPQGYIRKEELWDHMDNFADNALTYLREVKRLPDVIHGHYADAGYVAVRVANQLGVPMAFTGHSLGRVKRRRLLAGGFKQAEIENQYNISDGNTPMLCGNLKKV